MGNNKELKISKDRKEAREVPNRVDEKYSIGAQGHRKEKLTRTTIGNGNLIITDKQTGPMNRDIGFAEEITKNSIAKETMVKFDSNPHSWRDFSRIMSSNAGTIGKFVDDITNNTERKNEIKYRDTVYKIITAVENKITLKNQLSLIPANKYEGGLPEQVSKMFIKDKNDIVEIKVRRNDKGEALVKLRDVSRISEVDSDRVFGNGITETLPKAVANAIGKLMDREMIDKYNRGEEIVITLVHNRSRGMLADGLESIFGKIFDGSGSSLGIATGATKGQMEALLTRDNKQISVVIYSQNNLLFLGTTNKGTDMEGVSTRSIGSPVANAETKRSVEKVGGKVEGSATNKKDIVGNNENLIGFFIGETNAITLDNGKKAERSLVQIIASNIPILKSGTRYGNGVIFNNRPVIYSSYEKTETYYANPNREYWNDEGNYVLSNKDVVQIARNQKDGLLTEYINPKKINIDNMSDYEIATSKEIREGIGKILDNAHRRYTYNSPIYSENIYTTINEYRNGSLDYSTAQKWVRHYEEQNQLDFINLLKNGPSVWEYSYNVNKAVDELLYTRMVTGYENGVYRNNGLVNYTPIQVNTEQYVRENISVPEIREYLNRLKDEVRR